MNDSEKELLKAWLEASGADGPDSDYQEREREAFLRVLRTIKAVAWSEGYSGGWLDAQVDTPHKSPNPYRDGEIRK